MIQNNRQHQRLITIGENHHGTNASNQHESESSRTNDVTVSLQNRTIQSGVTRLGEALWRRRKSSEAPFVFIDERTAAASSTTSSDGRRLFQPASEVTLSKLEHVINTLSLQYHKASSLPAEPPKKKEGTIVKDFSSTLSSSGKPSVNPTSALVLSSAATTQSNNSHTSLVGSFGEPQAHQEHLPFASPTKQVIQNQDNSSVNEFSNTRNSPQGGVRLQPVSMNHDVTKNDSGTVHQQKLHTTMGRATENIHPNRCSRDNSNPAVELSRPIQGGTTTETSKSDGCVGDGCGVESRDEDGYDDYDIIFANIDVDKVVSQHQQSGSGPRNITTVTATSKSSSWFGQRDRDAAVWRDDGSSNMQGSQIGGFDYGTNYDINDDDGTGDANWHGSSIKPSTVGNNNSWMGTDNYASDFPNINGGSIVASNVPLCSGHGIPCRTLTANTSINMGRKFYKCSLPDDQKCDFFQWVDGIEGNRNDAPAGEDWRDGPMMMTTSGDIRDMNEGNRRVFGHRSFRPGQQAVIQKAIEGRDVFVLMPTGYVLCYS